METQITEVIGSGYESLLVVAALQKFQLPCRWLKPQRHHCITPSQLLLDKSALTILKRLFPNISIADLAHPLTQRLAYWPNAKSEAERQPREYFSINCEQLSDILVNDLALRGIEPQPVSYDRLPKPQDNLWRIYTELGPGDLASSACRHFSCGKRTLEAANVNLSGHCLHDSFTVEATELGWLMLIPHNKHQGSLLWSELSPHSFDEFLADSVLIAPQVECFKSIQRLPQSTGLSLPLAGVTNNGGWIMLGEQVARIDYFSGQYMTFLLNTVLNASMTVEAIQSGRIGAMEGLMYYQSCLTLSFIEQIKDSIPFYDSAFESSVDWSDELTRTLLMANNLNTFTRPNIWLESREVRNGRLY